MEARRVAAQSVEPELPGPFPVGRYARKLQEELRRRARVRLVGEVTGVSASKVQAYFELRDGDGACPARSGSTTSSARLPEGGLRDGAEVVIAGGPDYYPGGARPRPSFSFRATHVRLAGEGDLLARLEALRKQLRAEGLFELQKQLARPLLPRTIGVVTAEAGAARRDFLAGLERRGWRGRSSGASRRSRTAARRRRSRRRSATSRPGREVEAIVVTRGGGSLADLWAFCDETLCRTVALLRVPVISAVGHERDSTLIDDVAAVAARPRPTPPRPRCARLRRARARPGALAGASAAAADGRGRDARPASRRASRAARRGRCAASGSH